MVLTADKSLKRPLLASLSVYVLIETNHLEGKVPQNADRACGVITQDLVEFVRGKFQDLARLDSLNRGIQGGPATGKMTDFADHIPRTQVFHRNLVIVLFLKKHHR